MSATGSPAFTHDGKLLGVVSFLHKTDSSGLTRYCHIVPAAYVANLIATASHKDVAPFHGGDIQCLRALVSDFDKNLSPSEKAYVFGLRTKLIQAVSQSLSPENVSGSSLKSETITGNKGVGKRADFSQSPRETFAGTTCYQQTKDRERLFSIS